MSVRQALMDLGVLTRYRAPLQEHVAELSTTTKLIGSSATRGEGKVIFQLRGSREPEVFDSIEDFIVFAEALGEIGRKLRKR